MFGIAALVGVPRFFLLQVGRIREKDSEKVAGAGRRINVAAKFLLYEFREVS